MGKIKDLIDSPHPVYKNNYNCWNFLLNSYEGGKDYIGVDLVKSHQVFAGSSEIKGIQNEHLFRHTKETAKDYKSRIKMSYYYNFCAPIVDIYTSHLFKKPIISDWKGIDDIIDIRAENIDRMGSSIDEFRKELIDISQIYGHCFVIVDAPYTELPIYSKLDKIEQDNYPYMVIKHPQDIINWSLDEFGKPYWVLIRESKDTNTDPFAYNKENVEVFNYKLWMRDAWFLYDEDGNMITSGMNQLGYVPIVPFYNKRSKKVQNFLGVSVLADIAFIARDVYNSCSELKQILRDQTFALLTIQGKAKDFPEQQVGTKRGLIYPIDSNQPAFISPDAANAETYFKHITNQVSAMFRLAKLEGASAKFNGQQGTQQSGISKAYDFNETNQALSEKAMNMQDGEMKVWQIMADWESKKFEGSVAYDRDFNVQSLFEDLDEAEKAMKLEIGDEFEKEIKKTIIKKKFSRLPDEKLEEMVKDMETSQGQTAGGSLADRLTTQLTSDKTV